jgi:hypothetical protein
MPILDVWTRPRGNVPGLRLTDEDIGLLRGVDCDIDSRLNRIDRILIPLSYTFFSGSPPAKKSGVNRAWPRAVSRWVTKREVLPGVHK